MRERCCARLPAPAVFRDARRAPSAVASPLVQARCSSKSDFRSCSNLRALAASSSPIEPRLGAQQGGAKGFWIFGHRRSSSARAIAARARASLDMTVPMGAPVASAISL